MVIDSLIVPQTIIEPRSFAGLITLYESNYIRLRELFNDVLIFEGERTSTVPGDMDLYATLLERTTYTVTFTLSYRFADDVAGVAVDEPGMTIRVYLDANLAEAMALSERYVQRLLGPSARAQYRELDSRWARNSMLNKWFEYLSDCGHRL
ncbi:MAG: DUF1249 domain-containing protein [Pseudomonadota bacterium]